VLELSEMAKAYQLEEEMPQSELTNILVRLITFRAMVKDGSLTDSFDILSTAATIDEDLATWSSLLPKDWIYTHHYTDNFQDAYKGHYHVYNSFYMASNYNNCRTARILVNGMIWDQLNSLSPLQQTTFDFATVRQTTTNKILQLALEICSSVFFYLHGEGIPKGLHVIPPMARGVSLLWPLWVLGNNPVVPVDMKLWITEVLANVGRTMGIRFATDQSQYLNYLASVGWTVR
jgi:hypothetical protein